MTARRSIRTWFWIGVVGLTAFAPLLLGHTARWRDRSPQGAPPISQIIAGSAPEIVHAVIDGRVYRTVDSGRNWTSLAPQPNSLSAYSLAIDPSQPDNLLATNFSGIARTIDGGISWNQVVGVDQVVKVSFDPVRPRAAYGASRSALYRSPDGGASWADLHLPLMSGDYIADFAASRGGKLFVALNSSLLRSADAGDTWLPVVFPAPGNPVSFLVSDPVSTTTLYAVTRIGLFRSIDDGSSWSLRGKGFPSTLVIDPHDPATLYAGRGGIWKSTDAGLTWKMLSPPHSSSEVNVLSLAIDPVEPKVWAGTSADGFLTSVDGGQTFAYLGRLPGLPGPRVSAITADPISPGTVFAGSYSQSDQHARLYRTDDSGQRWTRILTLSGDPGYPSTVPIFRSFVIDPAMPTTLYAASEYCIPGPRPCSSGISKSLDGGLSWSLLSGGAGYSMAIDPENPRTLFASALPVSGFGYGVKSSDGGLSWTNLGNSFPRVSVSQWLVDRATMLVASCPSGVFASTDGGANWAPKNQGLTDLCVLSLAREPRTTGTLYAGTSKGVFKSLDGGMSWTPTGFSGFVRALIVDSADPSILFVGTPTGVFRSLDSAATWVSFNEGLGNLEINALAMDSRSAHLYAATNGGVFELELLRLARTVGPRQ